MCIAFVEDDEAIRTTMCMVLESEGYEVHAFEDGKEAIIALNNSTDMPDLIITDLMMPHITGWELVDILHKTRRFCKLPIIVNSAVAQYNSDNKALEGCYFLRKPCELDVLFDKVKQAIAFPWNTGKEDTNKFKDAIHA